MRANVPTLNEKLFTLQISLSYLTYRATCVQMSSMTATESNHTYYMTPDAFAPSGPAIDRAKAPAGACVMQTQQHGRFSSRSAKMKQKKKQSSK